MKGRYVKVATKFWTDEKTIDLDPETKLLHLYILTSPHSNMAGYYRLPKAYIKADLKLSDEQLSKGFNELLNNGLIKYCEKSSIILIPNYYKYNTVQNGNQAKGAANRTGELPKNSLVEDYIEAVNTYADNQKKELLEGLPKPLTKPLTKPSTKHFGNTELELDSELDTDTELETDKEHSPAEKKQDIPYKEIINYFNSVLDTNYKSSSAKTKSLIKARWNEGFRLDDFKIVINKKTAEWMGDKKCEKWLRPYTLFSNKFENYLNQLSDDDSKDEEKIMKKYLEDGLVLTDEEREKLGLNKPKKNMWGTEEE